MRLTTFIILITLSICTFAQNPPYDVRPDAESPYFRVRYEASTAPGELVFPVSYTIWIPPDVRTLRGVIVHQHGCGQGSCSTGLTGAYDLHWQALAKKHQCALLSASYEQPGGGECVLWCDPRHGSDHRFRKSLEDLGTLAGHPELADVPWALWGHSGGGAWVGYMTMLHPQRVAAVWLNSGLPVIAGSPGARDKYIIEIPDEAYRLPMMCNLGTQEGVTVKEGKHAHRWPTTEHFFSTVRAKGGLIGVAVDPLTGHPCGNQRYLAIPWFDACLEARLPLTHGDPLRPMPEEEAWFAPLNGTKASPGSQFSGDKSRAVWLPNETVALAWEHYIRDTEVPDLSPPPAPFNLKTDGGHLTWDAEADLESGIAHFIIERDGREIATVPNEPGNPRIRPVFQDANDSDSPKQPLMRMQFNDTLKIPGSSHTYRVISVNTAGLKSEKAIPATGCTSKARLIGHWPLDGDFQDLSGNGYHGTVSEQALEFVPGKHGQAADFRGASIINCGNVPLGTEGQLTVAVWVKPYKIEQPFAGFVQKQNTEYTERSFWMGQHPRHGYFAWAQFTPPTAKGTQLKTTKPVLKNNEWTHVAITMDGVYQRIYVNGSLDTISPERKSGIMDGGDNLRFGRVENTPGGRFSGLIDDIWIFGEALTEKEIEILMNGPSKRQLKKLYAK